MNKNLLLPEIQDFLFSFTGDPTKLLFQKDRFENVSNKELVVQLENRIRIKKKLPTWYEKKGILYPPKLNLEQTSSEITALYKSQIVKNKTLVDITGGFGIDSYFFSKNGCIVTHVEQNTELSIIAQHNFDVLNATRIKSVAGNGVHFIEDKVYDVIYIDPSRRNDIKGKVYYLSDCEPNVPKLLDVFFKSADTILIKTSPMLDISIGIKELKSVEKIHVVAVSNEVKEILWVLNSANSKAEETQVTTVNILGGSTQSFSFNWNKKYSASYNLPKEYLYEPNAALLKSGAFQAVGETLNVFKLHKHSHLYTSDTLIEFPGRSFKIESITPYFKKEIRKLGISKANITTRNFPKTVEQLKKELSIKDGGSIYLFFTTDCNDKKIMLLCKKVFYET